jgi:hypothetical protein
MKKTGKTLRAVEKKNYYFLFGSLETLPSAGGVTLFFIVRRGGQQRFLTISTNAFTIKLP